MTRQVSTLNVLASSQQPKTSRQDNNIKLSRLIKLTATMMQQQLLSMIWHYYNTDKSPSQISTTISLLANRPSNIPSQSPRDQNQMVFIHGSQTDQPHGRGLGYLVTKQWSFRRSQPWPTLGLKRWSFRRSLPWPTLGPQHHQHPANLYCSKYPHINHL